jgi:hypothetical protein
MKMYDDYARLIINTTPERRLFLDEAPLAYVYPAEIQSAGRSVAFNADNEAWLDEDLSDVRHIAVELQHPDHNTFVPLPNMVSRGLVRYIRTADWASSDNNCMFFAWGIHNLDQGEMNEAEFTPLGGEVELAPGDLLSVGTITNFMGIEFAKLRKFVHWAVYLNEGIALNVMGCGGILAGTPVENFEALYPGNQTFKVTGGAAE